MKYTISLYYKYLLNLRSCGYIIINREYIILKNLTLS